MAVSIKTDRLDIRVTEENKKILETAAKLKNLSLSAYILSIIIKQAESDIINNDIITLNNKDRDLIMNMLDETIEPNEKLVKLMKL